MPLTRLHRVVAFVACLLVPLATFAFDRGAVGYTMYAGIATYRLRLTASRGGVQSRVVCNDILGALGGSAARFVVGADTWRVARSTVVLRRHLGTLAEATCVATGADAVDVELDERGRPSERLHRGCR